MTHTASQVRLRHPLRRPVVVDPRVPVEKRIRQAIWRAGVIAAAAASLLLVSPLAFAAVAVLFFCVGLVWRPNEPVLTWCIGFQWLQITAAHWYFLIMGEFPGGLPFSDTAVWISLTGLTTLSVGVWAGQGRGRIHAAAAQADSSIVYSIPKLAVLTSALYSIGWLTTINPVLISFNGAQIIHQLLQFRNLFFFMLLLAVVRQRRHYGYCAIAVAIYWLPTMASPMSAFTGLFILVLLALASEWRPWSVNLRERLAARRTVRAVLVTSAITLAAALVWAGAVKPLWRTRVLQGQVTGSTTDVALNFVGTVLGESARMQWDDAAAKLAQRVSSSVYLFGLVLDRVPEMMPHEDGALTKRAFEHVITPRILFPDKPIVDSSSWIVRRYAGLNVAGANTGTSIGFAMMGEFYIDFGVPGMFVALFVYGAIVGLFCRALRAAAPSHDFFLGVSVVLLAFGFYSYEGELLLNFGGMLQAFLLCWPVLWIFGGRMHAALLKTADVSPRRPLAPARVPRMQGRIG
jgi:hypothetical protein